MYKVSSLQNTCDACPAQWEGYLTDDRYIYVRYRWGWLRIEVGGDPDPHKPEGETIFHERLGGPLDGYMDIDELKGHTAKLLDFSEATIS